MLLFLKKANKNFGKQNKSTTFAAQNERVPWMSGLVNGLQNRLQQFESARHLQNKKELDFFQLLFCALKEKLSLLHISLMPERQQPPYPSIWRCLTASYRSMAALTDTFSESSLPSMGMRIWLVAALRHMSVRPVDSVPITMAVGLHIFIL